MTQVPCAVVDPNSSYRPRNEARCARKGLRDGKAARNPLPDYLPRVAVKTKPSGRAWRGLDRIRLCRVDSQMDSRPNGSRQLFALLTTCGSLGRRVPHHRDLGGSV